MTKKKWAIPKIDCVIFTWISTNRQVNWDYCVKLIDLLWFHGFSKPIQLNCWDQKPNQIYRLHVTQLNIVINLYFIIFHMQKVNCIHFWVCYQCASRPDAASWNFQFDWIQIVNGISVGMEIFIWMALPLTDWSMSGLYLYFDGFFFCVPTNKAQIPLTKLKLLKWYSLFFICHSDVCMMDVKNEQQMH